MSLPTVTLEQFGATHLYKSWDRTADIHMRPAKITGLHPNAGMCMAAIRRDDGYIITGGAHLHQLLPIEDNSAAATHLLREDRV